MGLMDRIAYIAWLKEYIDMHKTSEETYSDKIIMSAISEVEQYIINYCRIPKVPNALKYVWANLALDLLRTQFPTTSGGGGGGGADPEVTGVVKEITTGDTSVKFDADASTEGGYVHKPLMDDLVYNYKAILQRFRMWQ